MSAASWSCAPVDAVPGHAAGSNGALAAIHIDRLAIHVRGEIRQKEHGDSSYLFRLGQTSQRYVCGKRMCVLTVCALRDARLCQRCSCDGWVDGIAPDAEWPQLHRRGARERYDTALAGAVDLGSWLRDLRENRAVEQYRAASSLHLGRFGFEAEERSLQVGRDHPIESRFVNGI